MQRDEANELHEHRVQNIYHQIVMGLSVYPIGLPIKGRKPFKIQQKQPKRL
jgi:hypothetical protein